MEAVVLITTVQPELLAWVASISFFMSLALTAIVSPNRRWFELAVIFAICFLLSTCLVGVIVQWIAGVELIHVEAIGRLDYSGG